MEEILHSYHCFIYLLWRNADSHLLLRTLEKGPHSPSTTGEYLRQVNVGSQLPFLLQWIFNSYLQVETAALGVPRIEIRVSFVSVSCTGLYWAMKYQSEFAISKFLVFFFLLWECSNNHKSDGLEARSVHPERGILPLCCCNVNISLKVFWRNREHTARLIPLGSYKILWNLSITIQQSRIINIPVNMK